MSTEEVMTASFVAAMTAAGTAATNGFYVWQRQWPDQVETAVRKGARPDDAQTADWCPNMV